jgi:hypothetical protein
MHSPAVYHIELNQIPDATGWNSPAKEILRRTFRTTFDQPGFTLLSFTIPISSRQLRACQIQLKETLDALFHERSGRRLVFKSMARFDQQVTTKFHLDGGPPESFLMLGYEPSEVLCALAMSDYTLAAWKLGITPADFLRDHNPMFASGAKLLEGAITPLDAFDPRRSNLLLVNNCWLPFDEKAGNLLGVMHQATILKPDSAKRRIINSTMMLTSDSLDEEAVSRQQQLEYATTSEISKQVAY